MGRHREDVWLLPIRKRASWGTGQAAGTLIPDLQPPELRHTHCGLRAPSLVFCVQSTLRTTSESRDQARPAAQPLAQHKLHIPTQMCPEGMNKWPMGWMGH